MRGTQMTSRKQTITLQAIKFSNDAKTGIKVTNSPDSSLIGTLDGFWVEINCLESVRKVANKVR